MHTPQLANLSWGCDKGMVSLAVLAALLFKKPREPVESIDWLGKEETALLVEEGPAVPHPTSLLRPSRLQKRRRRKERR